VSRRISFGVALAATASLGFVGSPARAGAQQAPTLEQRLARLCDDVEQLRGQLKISGLSLAVVKDDRVVLVDPGRQSI